MSETETWTCPPPCQPNGHRSREFHEAEMRRRYEGARISLAGARPATLKIRTVAEYNGHSFWARVEAVVELADGTLDPVRGEMMLSGRSEFGAKGVSFSLNWPSIGSQDPASALIFAEVLKHAANLAGRLQAMVDSGLTLAEVANEFFGGEPHISETVEEVEV